MAIELNGRPDPDRKELSRVIQRALAGVLREAGTITAEQYRRVMLELGQESKEAEHAR